jgi:hypothetical protein
LLKSVGGLFQQVENIASGTLDIRKNGLSKFLAISLLKCIQGSQMVLMSFLSGVIFW